MNGVGEQVLQGPLSPREAQAVFAQLAALTEAIQSNGASAHSWLSVVRNEIQYRHSFDVWYPCRIRKHERKKLGRLIQQWMRDPMAVDIGSVGGDKLGEFVAACSLIVSMCRVLWLRVDERSTNRRRSVASLGPIACLRQAGCL